MRFIAAVLLVVVMELAVGAQAPPPQGRGGGRGFSFGPPSGAQLFQTTCANCHGAQGLDVGGRTAPPLSTLNVLPPERIYQAITTGSMAVHAAAMPDKQKRDLTEFVARRPFLDVEGTGTARMPNRCTTNPPLGDLATTPAWNGWGGTNNARFQTAAAAGLTARDVPKLTLKWAFGFPGGGVSSSQPTVALGRVFVASDNRAVYSIDARSGCAYWSFHADSIGRFAPIIGPIAGYPGTRYAMYFVTGPGNAYAVDAQDGKLLWRSEVKGFHNVSASSTFHDGHLYIPLAGTETLSGANPDYECCRSRGGVAALDANTGKLLWKVDSIREPIRRLGDNGGGRPLWGPSGASVWNAPTIDPKRRRIYVGTGNSYGPVAADTSDSILALDMNDGHIVWSHQEFKGDSFMVGCGPKNPPGGNCPETLGPDWDFGGASIMLQALPNGRDVLVAAGKGGVAIALDPDANGSVLWRTTLYERQPPSALGLVLFGGTADGARAYFPLQQPGGGLTAVRLDTGAIEWKARLDTDRRGQGGAASSIPGAVFTGGWDGILRAVDGNGKVIWSFDTNGEFKTNNGVQARGGSLGPPGATIVNGMVYVVSGYIGVQQGTPGNILLAFATDATKTD
ncbi:MAG TPA: PQQ-binding-like beta-propeller repeat protein [Vicinamibacterales bacterium]|nr:PQQ-binding-like beta-propeller repeat protein [Vicinamibacterales bacterium]